MKGVYETEITENLGNDRNLILLGVRADADIQHLKKQIAAATADASAEQRTEAWPTAYVSRWVANCTCGAG